ncbi:NAD-dependent epimerase/dehydratase family protein [Ruegeria lacuscaerulensis]|uniref:NAD-dependent epimerase/dehydratase family protein n=1 Tax=Ruegeria lacuscaerulensis TaxID=55218 RepID=UPI0014810176|nr:NAD(P)-dependent oxidoreductase [Ruegeria lacuscaerulensis]
MRVLVTGGTGFLGQAVLRQLAEKPFHIGSLQRASSTSVDDLLADGAATVETLILKPELKDICAQVEAFSPDVIVHIAAVSRAKEDEEGIRAMLEVNTLLPSLLAQSAARCGAKGMVVCGTSWQTSSPENIYDPFNYYAATKQAAEDILVPFAKNGLNVISLRMFDNYGPSDWRNKVVDLVFNAVVAQEPLKMSPGFQKMDLVYVEDAAAAIVAATERAAGDPLDQLEVYGVSSGEHHSLRDLEALIGEITEAAPPIQWGERPYRPNEIMEPNRKLSRVPGWSPRVSLRKGLERVWESKRKALRLAK